MPCMKLATWNVNSLPVRLPQVLDWLGQHPEVGVLALQETKTTDDKFPVQALQEAGYQVAFFGQKTYNGVAIVARTPPEAVSRGIPAFDDPQKRVLAATVKGVRVVSARAAEAPASGRPHCHSVRNTFDSRPKWSCRSPPPPRTTTSLDAATSKRCGMSRSLTASTPWLALVSLG